MHQGRVGYGINARVYASLPTRQNVLPSFSPGAAAAKWMRKWIVIWYVGGERNNQPEPVDVIGF